MPASSIYTSKANFLSSQVRTLSNLPQPQLHNLPASGEHGDLPASVLQTVYYKLSIVARKQHNLIYSAQALRHVAEQIDALYWECGEDEQEGVLRAGCDLRLKENIDLLPASYPYTDDVSEEDLEAYQTLRARLNVASEALATQKAKKVHYLRMREMVRPLKEPRENVQPNLVTRDGELNAALEKTKMLAVLLAAQIQKAGLRLGRRAGEEKDQEKGGDDEMEEEDEEMEEVDDEREKVEGLKKLLG